jgi:hypothetical protein
MAVEMAALVLVEPPVDANTAWYHLLPHFTAGIHSPTVLDNTVGDESMHNKLKRPPEPLSVRESAAVMAMKLHPSAVRADEGSEEEWESKPCELRV